MKKYLLLLCFALTSIGASAQYYTSGFYVGIKAGANLSTVIGEYGYQDSRDNSSKVGLVAGLYGGYDILPWLGVGLEAAYSRQGSLTTVTNNKHTFELRELHEYVNVPVLVRFTPWADFEIYTGVQAGFLVNASINFKLDDINQSDDVMESCNAIEASIPIGIAYTFIDHLRLDFRYNAGLTDIYKSADWIARNSVFAVTLGYTIPL